MIICLWWKRMVILADACIPNRKYGIGKLEFGLAQIEKLDDLQVYRKRICDIYQDTFRTVDWIETPMDANEV